MRAMRVMRRPYGSSIEPTTEQSLHLTSEPGVNPNLDKDRPRARPAGNRAIPKRQTRVVRGWFRSSASVAPRDT